MRQLHIIVFSHIYKKFVIHFISYRNKDLALYQRFNQCDNRSCIQSFT